MSDLIKNGSTTRTYMIVFLALISFAVHAGELSFKSLTDTSDNGALKFQDWSGFEYKHGGDEYLFVSYDKANVGAPYVGFGLEFVGLGLGFKEPVTKSVNLYGQAGLYVPIPERDGQFDCALPKCEGLYYIMNDWARLHETGLVIFDQYEIRTKNGYGITVGAEMLHKFSKNTDLTIGLEVQKRVFNLEVIGISPEFNGVGYWMSVLKGVQSTNLKIGVVHRF